MDELLTMSHRELTRLEVMQRLKEKRLTQKEAAQLLGIRSIYISAISKQIQPGRSSPFPVATKFSLSHADVSVCYCFLLVMYRNNTFGL